MADHHGHTSGQKQRAAHRQHRVLDAAIHEQHRRGHRQHYARDRDDPGDQVHARHRHDQRDKSSVVDRYDLLAHPLPSAGRSAMGAPTGALHGPRPELVGEEPTRIDTSMSNILD
jgi:hypothetical protein